MRLREPDHRVRRFERLKEATGENATSVALDVAADYYLKMRGGTTAAPTGALEELMRRADEKGSLTPEEIADCLDVDELPVSARTSWSVGEA